MTSLRIFVFLLLTPVLLRAQPTPPLERLITVTLRNEPLSQALTTISRTGQFSFSYNPVVLNQSRPVSLRVVNRPVREVLGQLFGGTVRLRSRGNHVILLRADEPEQPKDFILDGYVIDGQTTERVGSVTVFERNSLRSALSNEYGYYRLKLPADLPAVRLEVRRQAYLNQSLTIPSRRSQPQNIYLTPLPRPAAVSPLDTRPLPTDSASRPSPILAERPVVFASADSGAVPMPASFLDRSRQTIGRWALSTRQLLTDINLDRDTLYRTWQVAFLPGIGTNRGLGGRIINDYSVNILIGYSLGVRKAEFGGLFNLVREDVQGVQAAGFGNLVGGNTHGVQLAGFMNTTQGKVGPVQLAGFVNTVGGTVRGLQAAGFLNVVRKDVQGLQLAGFLNADRTSVQGAQLAGFANVAGGNTSGFQAAGFANVVGGDAGGFQAAGFTNVVRGQLRGWQVSGFLNVARDVVSGRQVGFINLARSSERAPIGFFSYVQTNGYRAIEASANEVTPLNATFRTGVRSFYNLFTAGYNPGGRFWSYGYGLGTATAERRGWSVALEGSVHQLNRTDERIENLNMLLRLSPQLSKQIATGLGITAGPTLNGYYSNDVFLNPLRNQSLPAAILTPDAPDNTRDEWSGWLGWQVGLRYSL
ncbi:STN domain-containing protein [Spirosoma sp. 209]|uniref:STN domain-containing protein n=1 Tax=Spirosoma sp. 209 TaxID=1955701 RepID=UPI00098D6B7A|nr:STN domain-containing protein [Spirosoma sp. 209]